MAAARNETRDTVLGTRVRMADRWWLRLRGLMGTRALQPGEGLLLVPCTAVHTYGMGYAIDVAFLDRGGRVVALYKDLEPGRRSGWHREAHSALELPAGTLARSGTREGDQLRIEPGKGGAA